MLLTLSSYLFETAYKLQMPNFPLRESLSSRSSSSCRERHSNISKVAIELAISTLASSLLKVSAGKGGVKKLRGIGARARAGLGLAH